jgi:hypothetical protein
MMEDGMLQSLIAGVFIYIVGFNLLIGVLGALSAVSGQLAEARRQDPVERNLQRVSHSVAYITGALALIFGGYWPEALSVYTNWMPAALPHADQALPIIVIAIIGVSVIRIYTGLRAFRFFNPAFHETTPLLRPRAIFKAVIGIGGLVYLADNRGAYIIYADAWWEYVYDALWIAAGWCLVTGLVRLFLLRRRRLDGGNIEPPEWNWN